MPRKSPQSWRTTKKDGPEGGHDGKVILERPWRTANLSGQEVRHAEKVFCERKLGGRLITKDGKSAMMERAFCHRTWGTADIDGQEVRHEEPAGGHE